MGSWHEIYLVRGESIHKIHSSDPQHHGKSTVLSSNDMILDCMVGHVNICYLYVHPDNVSKLIKDDHSLSKEELLMLKVFRSYTPKYREEYYNSDKRKLYPDKTPEEFEKVIDSLVSKGFMSKNKAGSTQLTAKGKDVAFRESKI